MTHIIDRLTLVTVFEDSGISRYVSAYADVKMRTGMSYDRPMATVRDADGTEMLVTIKPFAMASPEEVESIG